MQEDEMGTSSFSQQGSILKWVTLNLGYLASFFSGLLPPLWVLIPISQFPIGLCYPTSPRMLPHPHLLTSSKSPCFKYMLSSPLPWSLFLIFTFLFWQNHNVAC